jgi:hypothetical protein
MADITHPKLLYAKGFLFLLGGMLAAVGLVLETPTLKTVALVAIVAWCFARSYYFAFYVVQHYIDPGYRFAGLWAFARHMLGKRREPK